MNIPDKNQILLNFIYGRLINVHGELANKDYMLQLEEKITKKSKTVLSRHNIGDGKIMINFNDRTDIVILENDIDKYKINSTVNYERNDNGEWIERDMN